MNIIFAIDEKQGYSKNNSIPWRCSDDLLHFKNHTINNIVIMGHLTFQSLNLKPLPNRINIILSSSLTSSNDYFVFQNLNKAIEFALSFKKEIFIIGGKDLILETLSNYNNINFYLTIINDEYNCDKFLNIDYNNHFELLNENKISNAVIKHYKCNAYNQADLEYLKLAKKVLKNGILKSDRTGTGTLSLFGEQMKFDLKDKIPILTTKFIPWKSCIKELLWFLKGQTNVKILQNEGVSIWNQNSSRQFLDSRKLYNLNENDIGAGYGFQWRHFGDKYINCETNYNKGIDQIENIIHLLKTDPNSRRIFLSAWNPCDLEKMALPPCHVSCQFYVSENKYLSCHLYQRSMDLFLGAPWNILSYSILTYILSKICGYLPNELIISIGDCHIYNDHLDLIKYQLTRLSYTSPQLIIKDSFNQKSIKEYNIEDFEIINYKYHEKINGKMSV
jgi:thymidylate synthase